MLNLLVINKQIYEVFGIMSNYANQIKHLQSNSYLEKFPLTEGEAHNVVENSKKINLLNNEDNDKIKRNSKLYRPLDKFHVQNSDMNALKNSAKDSSQIYNHEKHKYYQTNFDYSKPLIDSQYLKDSATRSNLKCMPNLNLSVNKTNTKQSSAKDSVKGNLLNSSSIFLNKKYSSGVDVLSENFNSSINELSLSKCTEQINSLTTMDNDDNVSNASSHNSFIAPSLITSNKEMQVNFCWRNSCFKYCPLVITRTELVLPPILQISLPSIVKVKIYASKLKIKFFLNSASPSTNPKLFKTLSVEDTVMAHVSFNRECELNAIQSVEIYSPWNRYIAHTLQLWTIKQSTHNIYKTRHQNQRKFSIVHFSDVKQLKPIEVGNHNKRTEIGGVSKYFQALTGIKEKGTVEQKILVLCSGNFLGPSPMSSNTKGRQMVDALNLIGVNYGVFGPREFDLGLRVLKETINGFSHASYVYTGSTTTWIVSNLTESNQQAITGTRDRALFVFAGVKIGLIGLCENWLDQCIALAPNEVIYHDVFETADRICNELKAQGAELIIALTNGTKSMDFELRNRISSIDLILGGGSEKQYYSKSKQILRSASNFSMLAQLYVKIENSDRFENINLSVNDKSLHKTNPDSFNNRSFVNSIIMEKSIGLSQILSGKTGNLSKYADKYINSLSNTKHNNKLVIRTKLECTTIYSNLEHSTLMNQLIDVYEKQLKMKREKPIGRTLEEIDPRPSVTHSTESILPNFITDLMVQNLETDLAIIDGTSICGTTVIPENSIIHMGDIMNWFPSNFKLISITVQGSVVQDILNAMIKTYRPNQLCQSFPHVNKELSFTINALSYNKNSFVENICLNSKPIEPDEFYSIAVEESFIRKPFIFSSVQIPLHCIKRNNEHSIIQIITSYFLDSEPVKKTPTEKTLKSLSNSQSLKKQRLMRNKSIFIKNLIGSIRKSNTNLKDSTLPNSSGGNIFTKILNWVKNGIIFNLSKLKNECKEYTWNLHNLTVMLQFLNNVQRTDEPYLLSQLLEETLSLLIGSEHSKIFIFNKTTSLFKEVVAPDKFATEQAPCSMSLLSISTIYSQVIHINQRNISMPATNDGVTFENLQSKIYSNLNNTHHKVLCSLTYPLVYNNTTLGAVQVYNKLKNKSNDQAHAHLVNLTNSNEPQPVTFEDAFTHEDMIIATKLCHMLSRKLWYSEIKANIKIEESTNHALIKILRILNKTARDESINKIVLKITENGIHVLNSDRASLFLIDKGKMWTVIPTKNLKSEVEIHIPVGKGVVGKCAETNEVLNIFDAYQYPFFNPDVDKQTGYKTKTILCIPLFNKESEQLIGVLQFINKNDGTVFNQRDIEVGKDFGNMCLSVLDNCRQLETLRKREHTDTNSLRTIPLLPINRIEYKMGWALVKKKYKYIVHVLKKMKELDMLCYSNNYLY